MPEMIISGKQKKGEPMYLIKLYLVLMTFVLCSCGRQIERESQLDAFGSNIYGSDMPHKTLSLTFDDGPAPFT